MKAIILSAGLGTRLRPLTEKTPKPLLPINGKPLLAYHIESLYKYGVRDILINTHYLSEQIEEFVEKISLDFESLSIRTVFEKELLGSAGAVKINSDFFSDQEFFFVVYGDNLTDINYERMLETHLRKEGIATIAVYEEEHPESKGIITFNEDDRVESFIEKPKPGETTSRYANAGIYLLRKNAIECLNTFNKTPLDFGYDFFPYLLEKKEDMYVYKMTEKLLDIGTLESYNKAQGLLLLNS